MKQNIINSRHKRFIGLTVLALIALLVVACSGTAQPSTRPATRSPQSLSETSPDMTAEGTPGAMLGDTSGSMMESEFDRMFIDMMAPHHQSAIEMANIAKQRAEHIELKQMAEAIITEQAAEIKQLQD
ncbi:hypothetical protein TFLX_03761 [Thermoflexales bacterium]|nr:hypothetical protein TFLX_03761 [Thermoflexales bacterium]